MPHSLLKRIELRQDFFRKSVGDRSEIRDRHRRQVCRVYEADLAYKPNDVANRAMSRSLLNA